MAFKKFAVRSLIGATMTVGALFVSPTFAAKDVTFAVSLALETLDPYNTNSTLNQAAGKAYYEGLYEFDKDLKMQPKLATEYSVSPDGLQYTFKLRPGVKFHDGTDFNADAVKATIDRVSNPENKLARYSQFNRVAKNGLTVIEGKGKNAVRRNVGFDEAFLCVRCNALKTRREFNSNTAEKRWIAAGGK